MALTAICPNNCGCSCARFTSPPAWPHHSHTRKLTDWWWYILGLRSNQSLNGVISKLHQPWIFTDSDLQSTKLRQTRVGTERCEGEGSLGVKLNDTWVYRDELREMHILLQVVTPSIYIIHHSSRHVIAITARGERWRISRQIVQSYNTVDAPQVAKFATVQ